MSGSGYLVVVGSSDAPDYSKMSLKQLKEAMSCAYGRLHEIRRLHDAFSGAQTMFTEVGDLMNGAQVLADQGWQGQAAMAASEAVMRNVGYYRESHGAAQSSKFAMLDLMHATEYHHDQVHSLKEEDGSYGAAVAATGNPMSAPHEQQRRQQKNAQSHATAVEQAYALDSKGREYSTQVHEASWPSVQSDDKNAAPPRTLPPPPPPKEPPPIYWPPPPPPRRNPPGGPGGNPHPITVPGGGRDPHRVDVGDPTQTAGVRMPPAASSTSPAGVSSYPTGSSPSVSSAPLPGANGGLAGGALGAGGLAGSGNLGGLGGVSGDEPLGPRNGAVGEGELGRGSASDLARGRSAAGAMAAEEEAGGRGMYPMGGAGQGRRNQDEERQLPDFLEELGDVWGAEGQLGVPPVIGESDGE